MQSSNSSNPNYFSFGRGKRFLSGLRCKSAIWSVAANLAIFTTSQAALTLGDVAIVRVNSTTDGFSVLALRDLSASDGLFWTDNGWLSSDSFRTGEFGGTTDILTSNISAGTVFNISAGTNFSTSGDQVFLFSGTVASPTLFYGIDWDNTAGWDTTASDTNTSAFPTALTNQTVGSSSLNLGLSLGNSTAYYYSGSLTGSIEQLLANLSDSANWTGGADGTEANIRQWDRGSFTISSSNFFFLGSDTTRGGSGTWTNSGGTEWSVGDSDGGPGVAWDSTKTAVFNGAGASTVTVSGTIDADNGLTFKTTGTTITGGTAIDLGGATAEINSITTDSAVTSTIGTNLTGLAGMTKAGAGTLVLTGDKTYTGGTTISDGVLQLGDGTTNGSVTGGVTNNATLTFNNGSAQTFGGDITGSGTVTKTGAGVLTLSGSNSQAGGTNIFSGTVVADHNNALGAGTANITAGALMATSGRVLANNISINPTITSGVLLASDGFENALSLFSGSGTGNTFRTGNSASGDRVASSPFAVEGSYALGVSSGTYTITTGNINTTGYANLALSVRLASFSLNSTNNGADGGDSVILSVSPDGGATFWTQAQINGNGNAYWSYSGGTASASRTYAASNASAVAPAGGGERTSDGYSTIAVSGLPTASNLQVRVAASNNSTNELWTIDNFRLTGDQLVDNGVVLGTTSSTGEAEFSGDVTLNSAVQLSAVEGGKVSFTGDIGNGIYGAKGITKIGDGVVVLGGTNTYTGTTVVNAGVLEVEGSTSATSLVTVNAGGKLAGAGGTIGGHTTIASNGKYSAGSNGAVGTQTFSGDLSLASGSIFEWELTSASTSTGFDTVSVGGTLTGSGGFRVVTDLSLTGSFWETTQTWSTIFGGAGTLTGWATATAASVYGTNGSIRNVASLGAFTIDGTSLTWTAIPEPTSALAGLLVGSGLLRRRRRDA